MNWKRLLQRRTEQLKHPTEQRWLLDSDIEACVAGMRSGWISRLHVQLDGDVDGDDAYQQDVVHASMKTYSETRTTTSDQPIQINSETDVL